jgi:hypothetical protein
LALAINAVEQPFALAVAATCLQMGFLGNTFGQKILIGRARANAVDAFHVEFLFA